MSNEYKEMLKAAARDFLDGTLQQDSETGEYLNLGEVEEIYSDISIELDHVYTRAAKAGEYEAKAKAYNDTLKTLDKLINNDERYKEARSNDFVAGMLIAYENIFNLMGDYIKESGELNAKKL